MMLSLEDGDAIYADVVVNATGAKAATVAEMVGRVLPLDVFPGLLVRVAVPGKASETPPTYTAHQRSPRRSRLRFAAPRLRRRTAHGRLRRNRGSTLRGASGTRRGSYFRRSKKQSS